MIYIVVFDPINIMTCWVLQNNFQNLSFVKAANVVGEKMVENTCKIAISHLCHFRFETEEFICKWCFLYLDYVIKYVSEKSKSKLFENQ